MRALGDQPGHPFEKEVGEQGQTANGSIPARKLSSTDCSGESVNVVIKMGPTSKAVVITVYREEE